MPSYQSVTRLIIKSPPSADLLLTNNQLSQSKLINNKTANIPTPKAAAGLTPSPPEEPVALGELDPEDPMDIEVVTVLPAALAGVDEAIATALAVISALLTAVLAMSSPLDTTEAAVERAPAAAELPTEIPFAAAPARTDLSSQGRKCLILWAGKTEPQEVILVARATALSPAVAARLPAFTTMEAAVETAASPAVPAISLASLMMEPASWAAARRGRRGKNRVR